MLNCVHCNKECKNANSHRNHERTCPSNLNRVLHTNGMTGKPSWNKGLTIETDERVKQSRVAFKISGKAAEKALNRTDDEKEAIRIKRNETAKRNGNIFGGYRENAGRSKKFRVIDSFGLEVCLQSTYELLCSEILNELGINWIRPKAIKYDTKRNYFADFYLVDYDIYLDPKNDYKAKLDEEKISKVIEQNNVKLFVLLKQNITIDYIQSLLLK